MGRRDDIAPRARAAARSDGLMLALIAGTSCFLFAALFSRFPLTTHEGLETYIRTHQYLQELGHGHWIPQVFPAAVRGAGSAFPSFYPPLAYMTTVALSFVLRDVVRGVNISLLLSVVLSGWAMYFCIVVLTRNRPIALAAALLYISFPYRFVDVFVRGALAESWSFVWFPLILAGTWRTVTRRHLPWYLPVAWAGLILTHVGMSLYFAFPYALFVLLALWREGWRVAGALVGAFAVAVGLTLWFIVPQQHLLHGVRANDPYTMDAYTDFVVRERKGPGDLIGTWHNGWRGLDAEHILPSGEACPHFYCGRSFVLGSGHVLMVVLLVGSSVAIAGAWARRLRLEPDERRMLWLVPALLAGYAFNLAFILNPGAFLAVLPATFGYIQLPWRLLGTAAFFAATVVAIIASSRIMPRWVGPAVLLLSVVVALAVPSYQRKPAVYRGASEAVIVGLIPTRSDRGFTVQGEYLPKQVNAYDIGPYLIPAPQVRGDGRVVRWHRRHGDLDATVATQSGAVVVLPLLYYDFYKVTGSHVGRLDTFNSRGLLAVRVPAGTTDLHVSHGLSASNWRGLAATLASAVVLGAVVVRRRRAQTARHEEPPLVELAPEHT
jgi:hypothetical protein